MKKALYVFLLCFISIQAWSTSYDVSKTIRDNKESSWKFCSDKEPPESHLNFLIESVSNSTCIFERTTNGTEDYTVPAGITELTIEAVGASGSYINSGGIIGGGTGGTVTATFTVTPGDIIRFIVGEEGERAINGGGGGGGATAVINCGNSGGNCDAGNGTVLLIAGGGGGAGLNPGLGATTSVGDGSGGLSGASIFKSGGGGGFNTMGEGVSSNGFDLGGEAANQNPTFDGSRRSQGYIGGGLGASIGGNGGGGGGYTGGNGGQTNESGGDGGSNFVNGTAINVSNLAGIDGAATTFSDGSVCIVSQVASLPVSLSQSTFSCGNVDLEFIANAVGATNFEFFIDNNQNGSVDIFESLQNGTSNIYIASNLVEGDVLSVIATDGTLSGLASFVVPQLFPFSRATPGIEDYTVPAGVTEIDIEASGGTGALINSGGTIGGGTGGTINATFSVAPGDVIRFIVGEHGVRNSNGGGGGGGSTAVIHCGTSAVNCDNGSGTVLLIAGGGGGAGIASTPPNLNLGKGATTIVGNGDGGAGGFGGAGGAGGFNGDGNGGNSGLVGAGASQNPSFTNKAGEGYTGGGQGTGIGGNGGGGGGYTGGDGAPSNGAGGLGGSNFVIGSATNVVNTGGVDGAATTSFHGSACILSTASNLLVTLSASSINCSTENVTYTATATSAINYDFYLDNNANGIVDAGESLQNGNSNIFVSNTLSAGTVLSVVATDGTIDGKASVVVPTANDTTNPVFTNCQTSYTVDLNLCGDYVLDATTLGLEATDNCNVVDISFSPSVVSTTGTTSITATATDGVNLIATCVFDLITNNNPDAFVITATDDNFSINQFESITFTDADLLNNDNTSPAGFTLEVEEVTLNDPAQGTLTQIDASTYSFTPNGNFTGSAALSYTVKVLNGASFFEGNGNFYEVIDGTNLNWVDAKNAAESQYLAGLQGYLATITTPEENEFIASILTERAWIGASDAATEGDWRWVTGPEGEANNGEGTPFWLGDASGSPVNGEYNNWVVNNGMTTEPNNLMASGNPGEFYALMYPTTEGGDGNWNDFPLINTLPAYVVEYGGLNGCSPNISANANISIDVIPNPQDGFITTWKTTISEPDLTIYTSPQFTYDYSIDWGDGSPVVNNVTGNISHTYTDHTQLHTIKIAGTFPHFWADNNNVDPFNARQLQSIDQWGSIQWQSMFRAFNNALFMKYNATDTPDLSNCISVQKMFNNCFQLDENTDLSSWDVSNITDFTDMFNNAFNFNGDISTWTFNSDPSTPVVMPGMFRSAANFNSDITNWNVSNVVDIREMFKLAINFNQDIGGWNVSKVTNMIGTFQGATIFNQDITNWDVSSVIELRATFAEASSFNQDISGWNVSGVTAMGALFNNATSFDQNLGSWDITGLNSGISLLRVFTNSGMSTTSYDNTLIGWAAQNVPSGISPVGVNGLKYCNGKDARQDLIDNHGWFFSGDELDPVSCGDLPFITTWTTTAADPDITIYADVNSAFNYVYNYTVDWGDGTIETNQSGNASHTYSDHTTPQTVKISGEFPRFIAANNFSDSSNAIQLKSIEQWGSIEWESMQNAFAYTQNLVINATDVPDLNQVSSIQGIFIGSYLNGANNTLNNWDVSKVVNMNNAFTNSLFFNGDISRWDVSNVSRMSSVFRGAQSFNQPLNNWDVSNVSSMGSMFQRAFQFNQPLDNWDVSNVRSMKLTFGQTNNFNQPLDNWDVSSVTDMYGMFLRSFYNQPLNSWDVSSVTDMSGMFSVTNYNQPLNSWDVSSVTDMFGMFKNAFQFNQPLNSWDVSSVTNMRDMFEDAISFNQPLNSWDVSNVTNMSDMFERATSFNQPLNNWNVSSVTNMFDMFRSSTSFNQPLNNWNVSSVTNMCDMFDRASSFDQDLGAWNLSSLTNGLDMLDRTGLSVSNYDSTLIGWDNSGVSFSPTQGIGVEGLQYSPAAATARANLISRGWILQGDSPE